MNFFEKETRRAAAASSYIKIAAILICVLTVFAALALAVFNSMFIGENGLYTNGAPTFLPILLAVFSLAICIYGTMNITKASKLEKIPHVNRRLLWVVAALFIAQFFSIFIIYILLGPIDLQYGVTGSLALVQKMKTVLVCYEILVPLALFAPVYFVFLVLKRQINAFFGSVTLIWILLYILRLYFDVTDWVMSPRKLTMICAMCIAAIFILYEIRFALSRGDSRKYFFFAALSAIFCFSCGFAGIWSVFSGAYPFRYELPYFSLTLTFGIYALVRVISFVPKKHSRNEAEEFEVFEETEEGVIEETDEESETL